MQNMRLFKNRFGILSALAIMLPLMLCGGGCANFTRPTVSALPTATGNAFRLGLPAGTRLVFRDAAAAERFRAVALNEISRYSGGDAKTVVLGKPLQIVSPAWIEEVETIELDLHRKIDQLETELRQLRNERFR